MSHTYGTSQVNEHLASTNLGKIRHTAPGEDSRVFRELERIYYSFVLWGDGLDILEGRLDDLLQYSTLTRVAHDVPGCLSDNLAHEDVAKHVAQLDDACEETSFGVALDGEDSSESEDEPLNRDGSHHHSTEDLDNLIEDLDTDVQCLVDLTPALQSPAWEGADERVDVANAGMGPAITEHRPFTELIRSTFPKADIGLAERLGQLNWERWLRLQEQRRSNEEEENQEILQLDARTVAPSSKFRDSGVGASLPAATRYTPSFAPSIAPSVNSTILEGNRPIMPPLPKSAESGDAFTCPACSRLVRVSTKELWKKHLISDLKPYVCVFAGCRLSSSPTLGLSDSFWIDHLKSEHSHDPGGWGCPLCFKQVGTNARRFCALISRHMEDIAMATLPRDCDSENNSANGDELTSHGGEEDDSEHGPDEHAATGPFTGSLLLYNLGDNYSVKELEKLSEGFKNVVDVRIMTNPDGTSKGFGYADFLDKNSALRAFADLKMRPDFGTRVGVKFVIPNDEFKNFEARLSAKEDLAEKSMSHSPMLQRWEDDEESLASIKEPENSPSVALEAEDKSIMEDTPDANSEPEATHKVFNVSIYDPERGHSSLFRATEISDRESLVSDNVLRQLNLLSELNQESTAKLDWRFFSQEWEKTYSTRFKIMPDVQMRTDLALGRNAYENLNDDLYIGNACPLPTDSLYLGNLGHKVSEKQFWFLLSDVENVIDAWIVVDKETSICKGFGYARFADAESAQSALRLLHGKEVNGRVLCVDYTRSGTRRPEIFSGSNSSQGHETRLGVQIDPQRPTLRHYLEVFEEGNQIKQESIERENEREAQDPTGLGQRTQGKTYACAYCEVRFRRRHDSKQHGKMHIPQRRNDSDDENGRETDINFAKPSLKSEYLGYLLVALWAIHD
ncbi:MAG: hypothetical protein Q9165_005040 [Trypethelium subeluteriae]